MPIATSKTYHHFNGDWHHYPDNDLTYNADTLTNLMKRYPPKNQTGTERYYTENQQVEIRSPGIKNVLTFHDTPEPAVLVVEVEFTGKCADLYQRTFEKQVTHLQMKSTALMYPYLQDNLKAQLIAGNVHGFGYQPKKNHDVVIRSID